MQVWNTPFWNAYAWEHYWRLLIRAIFEDIIIQILVHFDMQEAQK